MMQWERGRWGAGWRALVLAGVMTALGILGGHPAQAAPARKAAKPARTAAVAKKAPPRARAAAKTAAPRKAAKASARAGGSKVVARTRAHSSGKVASRRSSVREQVRAAPPPRPSFGQLAGLHETRDPLDLKSSVALVLDQDTREVLLSKNEQAVLPIASLTKLMTGLLVADSDLPLDEMITITEADVDTMKGSSSRLPVGTRLTRGELLHLALMSSENRAAHALGRTYPGGMSRFVALMNARAALLGMKDTRYVEPTGLSSANQSSAQDLALLVAAASRQPLMRALSTSAGSEVAVGSRVLQYGNTNGLVHSPDWDIDLQKTGYISEAGRCLVMQAHVAGRKLIMVFLDSAGKHSRIADAERVRRWVESMTQPGLGTTTHASAG